MFRSVTTRPQLLKWERTARKRLDKNKLRYYPSLNVYRKEVVERIKDLLSILLCFVLPWRRVTIPSSAKHVTDGLATSCYKYDLMDTPAFFSNSHEYENKRERNWQRRKGDALQVYVQYCYQLQSKRQLVHCSNRMEVGEQVIQNARQICKVYKRLFTNGRV